MSAQAARQELLDEIFETVDQLKELTDRLKAHTEAMQETPVVSLTARESEDTG